MALCLLPGPQAGPVSGSSEGPAAASGPGAARPPWLGTEGATPREGSGEWGEGRATLVCAPTTSQCGVCPAPGGYLPPPAERAEVGGLSVRGPRSRTWTLGGPGSQVPLQPQAKCEFEAIAVSSVCDSPSGQPQAGLHLRK